MAATITEIAREAKVSPALVSRFFRNDPTLRVSEETSRRLETVAQRLGGLKINRAARSLSTQLAHQVILPINRKLAEVGLGSEVANSLMKSFEDVMHERDFHVSIKLFDADDTVGAFKRLIDSPDHCDGLLILTGAVNEEIAKLLLERRFPHVAEDPEAEIFGVNTVTAHAISGLRQAVLYLLDLGHKHIGFFGHPKGRYPLYGAVMLENQLPFNERFTCIVPKHDPLIIKYKEWLKSAGKLFSEWLGDNPPVTALLCQNDDMAFVAMEVMKEKGFVPGKDISVIGYDNIEQRGSKVCAHPVLTTIDNPTDVIGRRCGELLLNQILYKQKNIVHEHIPTQLIVRETTGPVRESSKS